MHRGCPVRSRYRFPCGETGEWAARGVLRQVGNPGLSESWEGTVGSSRCCPSIDSAINPDLSPLHSSHKQIQSGTSNGEENIHFQSEAQLQQVGRNPKENKSCVLDRRRISSKPVPPEAGAIAYKPQAAKVRTKPTRFQVTPVRLVEQ